MMYDERVKSLREATGWKNASLHYSLMKQAADAIEELSKSLDDMNEANIALYGALPKWIPVTERLPEDLKFVLAVEDEIVFMAHCEHYYGEEEVFVEWHDTMYYPASPTHWMPLPEPPKEE